MNDPAEKLWFQFGRQLSEYICRKVGHLDHCHDLLQEVYIKISQNIDQVEKADNVGAYLIRIAGNVVNDHYRARRMQTTYADSLTSAIHQKSPTEILPEPDNVLQLADCCLRPMIESLPQIYRDALVWTQLEGMSQKDLAEKLGLSPTGARSRVQRAREKLKEVILACCTYEFDRYGNILSCKKRGGDNCCD